MVVLVALTGLAACRETLFDIVTNERTVGVPATSGAEFTIETGPIDLPASLGEDKTVDSATLDLVATNHNVANPVTVAISVADARSPNAFGPVGTFDLAAGETRQMEIVQRGAGDALVRASQSQSINVRFESASPAPGLGALEFRFKVRVLAHKDTPGTGAGTLLFY